MNGNASELENMKQEILREMRKEIAKAKLEIIEGKFSSSKFQAIALKITTLSIFISVIRQEISRR